MGNFYPSFQWLCQTAVYVLLLGLFPAALGAQTCDRIGWVAEWSPDCGAKLIDLETGEKLRVLNLPDHILGGQTIRFAATLVPLPLGCPNEGLSVSMLTCVSDTLPCQADFSFEASKANPLQFAFKADVYEGGSQQCTWEFSDGATATHKNVQHTFPQEGVYGVKLTVTDPFGCNIFKYRNIYVSGEMEGSCAYDIALTAVGTQLYGHLLPTHALAGNVSSVEWYLQKTRQVLGHTTDFSSPLPSYGNYLVCADFTTADTDNGTPCTSTVCRSLNVPAPECTQTPQASTLTICPPTYAPVCGCNNVTYNNQCEASSAGVKSWWSGQCGAQGVNCSAALEVTKITGNPNNGFVVQLSNTSVGNFSYAQIDFDDGTPIVEVGNWDTLSHFYATAGNYRLNLTIWKEGACISSLTQLLATDALHATTAVKTTDYVMPGDANGDGRANAYDLLNIGVGFYQDGVPRPFAHTAWAPQFSPNWPQSLNNSKLNFKHIDCDGNGTINVFDTDPIEQHYAALDTTVVPFQEALPQVRFEFSEMPDTIVLDLSNPEPIKIKGDLVIGSPQKPALGLYGLALALQYPEAVAHNPEVNYDDNSFFGFTNHILLLHHDEHARQQLDMGFTRTNGINTGGYGRIADVTFSSEFIIIVDIIERSSDQIIPFVVPVKGLYAVNKDGVNLNLSVPFESDTIWIKLPDSSSATRSPALDDQIVVSPNPATTTTSILGRNLEVQHIQAVNALGQVVLDVVGNGRDITTLNVTNWPSGIYTLHLRTDQGMAEKRLMVK